MGRSMNTCECAQVTGTGRIVGGKEVTPKYKLPYQVYFQVSTHNTVYYYYININLSQVRQATKSGRQPCQIGLLTNVLDGRLAGQGGRLDSPKKNGWDPASVAVDPSFPFNNKVRLSFLVYLPLLLHP